MIVTVNSQVLASELRLLKNIVPTKPAIAILNHALLHAEGDALHFYATDLEVGLSTNCPAQVTTPGDICLPVAKFLSLVEQFPDADVALSLDKSHVQVRCAAFKSRLQAMPAKDFPKIQEVEGVPFTLDFLQLRQLIERVRPAISANSNKYVLKGALLTVVGSVAAMVSTDGTRLVLTTMNTAESNQRFVIPMKALDVLSDQSDGGDIEIIADKHLQFTIGDKVIISRTIDGEFPKYERIIPRENHKQATIDRSGLMAALKRILVAADANKAVYVALSTDAVELSSASAEVGSASEMVSANYSGEPLKICINGEYVLDFLQAASSAAVTMAVKDATGASLWTDGPDHVCVIMLMRS